MDTRESESRRFYLGNSSSFGGYVEIFSRSSSGIRAVDACWIDAFDSSWANLPLSRPLLSPLYCRFLPNFTDVYRFVGLSWEDITTSMLLFE